MLLMAYFQTSDPWFPIPKMNENAAALNDLAASITKFRDKMSSLAILRSGSSEKKPLMSLVSKLGTARKAID